MRKRSYVTGSTERTMRKRFYVTGSSELGGRFSVAGSSKL